MTNDSDEGPESALRSEALRVYRRYMLEVVEGFTLCPWAAAARRDGHVAECVILAENRGDPQQSLTLLASLEKQFETEIALFIYPDLELDRLGFEGFDANAPANGTPHATRSVRSPSRWPPSTLTPALT